jgi:hypothetical protein
MQMSGALHYYTDRTYVMWNMLDAARLAQLRAETEGRGYRWYALLAPFEQEEVKKNFRETWREIDRTGDVALWELVPSNALDLLPESYAPPPLESPRSPTKT